MSRTILPMAALRRTKWRSRAASCSAKPPTNVVWTSATSPSRPARTSAGSCTRPQLYRTAGVSTQTTEPAWACSPHAWEPQRRLAARRHRRIRGAVVRWRVRPHGLVSTSSGRSTFAACSTASDPSRGGGLRDRAARTRGPPARVYKSASLLPPASQRARNRPIVIAATCARADRLSMCPPPPPSIAEQSPRNGSRQRSFGGKRAPIGPRAMGS